MKEQRGPCFQWSDAFYGSATLGERGQIVIPAEARAELGLSPGDKLLILRHPIHSGLVLFKIEAAREFLDDFHAQLQRFEQEVAAGGSSTHSQEED